MDKKNKFPLFSLIMLCVGVGLILFGAIAPAKMFSGNNTYVVEFDRSGFDNMRLRITLNTDEAINPTITALIHEEEIYVIVKQTETGMYKGSASIDRDKYFMSREDDVSVIVSDKEGKTINFKQKNEFGETSGRIILTTLPIFFGIFITILALVLGVAVKHRNGLKKAFNGTVSAVAGAVGTISQAITPKNDEKYCEYCECYNEKDAQKCKYCGAPLKNYKKEK